MPFASLDTTTVGSQPGDMAGRRAQPMKVKLAVLHDRPASPPDSKAQPQTEATVEDQGQKLQDADAAMGRPLFLVQKRTDPQTSDLLHQIAGGKKRPPSKTNDTKGAEPPVKPEVIVGPDGEILRPSPQETKPGVGIPEPLPPTPPKPNPEVGCAIAHERCEKTCKDIKPSNRFKLALKGACHAFCFAALASCRFLGSINNSQ